MADKDVVNKSMFSNPLFVADLFNQVFFNGKKIINPSYIATGPTDLCLFKKTKKSISVTKREADICKIYYRGKDLPVMVLCIENQTVYDKTMITRIKEYNQLIKEDLLRQLEISENDKIMFFNIVVTYSGSRKDYITTGESDLRVIKLMDEDRDITVIREFRPKNDLKDFSTDIGILFRCIYLNKKRTEKELYEYVKCNLDVINGYPDIAYYLRETTNIQDIVVDPSKIKGNEGTFMSLWTVLQEESKKEGKAEGREEGRAEERADIICKMNEKGIATIEMIAELFGISEEEVLNIINQKSGD